MASAKALFAGKGCQVSSNYPVVGQLAANAGLGAGTTLVIDILQPTKAGGILPPIVAGILSLFVFQGDGSRKLGNAIIAAASAFATDRAINRIQGP